MTYNPDLEIQQDIPLKEKLLKKGFWLYFFSFITAPTGYVIKVLISRSLPVEDVGLIYSIIGFISILATYNDLGLTDSLQYYLPNYLIDKNYSKAKSLLVFTRISQFATGLLIGGLLIWGAPRLAINYFQSHDAVILLRIFALYFLIINLFQVIQSIFYATQSVKIASGIDTVRLRVVALFVFGFRYLDLLDIYYFAWSWLGGLLCGLCAGLLFGYKKLSRLYSTHISLDCASIKERLHYGIWILIGANASTIMGQIDQQFALLYFGKQSAGYRSNYMSMTAILSVVTVPLMNYFLPLFVELTKKSAYHDLKKLFIFAYGWFGMIALCVGLIAYFYGVDIAILLFGEKFAVSGELYKFYAPFMAIGLFMSINFQYLASIGKVKVRVKLVIIAVIITLITNFILVDDLGLKGLVIGNVMGWFVLWLSTMIIIYQNSSYRITKSISL